MELDVMRFNFYTEVAKAILSKGQNNQLFSKEKYYSFIEELKILKQNKTKKTPRDYHKLEKYDVATINGTEERLIMLRRNPNAPIILFAYLEEMFDLIHDTHINQSHSGRNKTVTFLKKKYRNITAELVLIYLKLCESCSVNYGNKSRLNPNQYTCQLDIINMEDMPDGEKNFLMVYMDCDSKFMQLRGLRSLEISDISSVLLDIIQIFGLPSTLLLADDRFEQKTLGDLSKAIQEHIETKEQVCIELSEIDRSHYQKIKETIMASLGPDDCKWSMRLTNIQIQNNQAYNELQNSTPQSQTLNRLRKLGMQPLPKNTTPKRMQPKKRKLSEDTVEVTVKDVSQEPQEIRLKSEPIDYEIDVSVGEGSHDPLLEGPMSSSYETMNEYTQRAHQPTDEITAFANFIASKMRKYDHRKLNRVQQQICNILFNADEE